jgi:hypothetical protein
MQLPSQKHQDKLANIKKNIEESYEYFTPNYKRWAQFMRFVFLSSLSDNDIAVLEELKKPQLEFNVLEAYISRLRGEFSKQEPSIEVRSDYGEPVDELTIETVEGIIRGIIDDANKNGCEYKIYTDLLAGGFSAFKVWTAYNHDKSFDQVIKIDRVYDPTMCGFDPMARDPHKGDGQYCFELYPISKDEFLQKYPDIDLSQISFTRNVSNFNWSYKGGKKEVLLLGNYYEKKKKRTKIVKLSTNHVMTMDQYKDLIDEWTAKGILEQPPIIVDERFSEFEVICRYKIIENKVLEYVETDFKYLPIVFVDGNSALIRKGTSGELQQHTRPYVYNAMGTQKLKNFAGQTMANELENMVQHKFIVAKESIPNGYEGAYTNVQVPSVIIYNAFKDNDPSIPLPAPREVSRTPIPQEVTQTFSMMDQMTQVILGSYDASLGINNNQLSGVAIVEAATQSNSAAMPYVVGFMQGLNQVAQIIIDLIPKYYKTPRTIPVVTREGKKGYVNINTSDGINLDYADNALGVRVEAGVNFAIQKSRALNNITALMQASPAFANFINTMGLPILVDNLEIRGGDQLKVMAEQYQENMQQQQQAQAQQQQKAEQLQDAQTQTSLLNAKVRSAEVKNDIITDRINARLKAGQLALDQEKVLNDRIKLGVSVSNQNKQDIMQQKEIESKHLAKAVDLAINAADMDHRHKLDVLKLNKK